MARLFIQTLETAVKQVFPELQIQGGASEPFYQAPTQASDAMLFYREDFPRSLLHELAHFCLAGPRRRKLDDFGFWYHPTGRTPEQQFQFECVEARPQALEKCFCETVGLSFSPSLDDFSGRPPSEQFLEKLDSAYIEMRANPPPTASRALSGLQHYVQAHRHHFFTHAARM